MPVEMKMWRVDGDEPRPLQSALLPSEAELEEFLAKDPSLLGTPLLVIGRQVRTPYNKYIDLLAIDADGNLHVLELKRGKTSSTSRTSIWPSRSRPRSPKPLAKPCLTSSTPSSS
jgi:hypothetical protein